MPLRTKIRNTGRRRSALDRSLPPRSIPALIANVDATAADTIQITFATRVQKSKTPAFTAGAGGAATVESITQVSDTVIELTFTGDVQGTNLIVPEGDPGIRTAAGGFVPAGSYAIPTFP